MIAMGKLGGCELNVSSDVDLIFVYPEDGETDGHRSISNHDFFARLGRKLIGSLNDITPDGYVFRVDMRLRPYGESGPLVMSFAMLEEYFISQGREWERYAWIKGRAIAGSACRKGGDYRTNSTTVRVSEISGLWRLRIHAGFTCANTPGGKSPRDAWGYQARTGRNP